MTAEVPKQLRDEEESFVSAERYPFKDFDPSKLIGFESWKTINPEPRRWIMQKGSEGEPNYASFEVYLLSPYKQRIETPTSAFPTVGEDSVTAMYSVLDDLTIVHVDNFSIISEAVLFRSKSHSLEIKSSGDAIITGSEVHAFRHLTNRF